jgi:peptidyl-prolyl cis-trans isomerase D
MLQFFRNMTKRPLGISILVIIVVAFIVTLYQGNSLGGAAGDGATIASAGNQSVTDADVTRRAMIQLDTLRREQPTLDMAGFVAQGGVEQIVNQVLDANALSIFGAKYGLIASDKLIDGTIAGIPAFAGPDGKFDQNLFNQVLSQRGLSQVQVREDIGLEALQRMILTPVAAAPRLPQAMIDTYANLLTEVREGQVTAVPAQAFAAAPPSDADVATFYKRNIARYTVPEQRVVQFATFDQSIIGATGKATDAEIAEAYKKNAARYAASEQRGLTQIIVPDQAQAQSLLGKIQGGVAMATAATSIGLEPLTIAPGDRAAIESATAKTVADAAFATPQGALAPLTRSALGIHIIRVDAVRSVAARTLEQVRGELTTEIEKTKGETVLANLIGRIDDAAAEGASFNELTKQFALTGTESPQITASGISPANTAFKAPPELSAVLRDAFQAETGDDAQVSAVPQQAGRYILYDVARIIPPAAPALAAIRDQVIFDARIDTANRAARKAADAIAAAVNKGTALAQAIISQGVRLPPSQLARGTRIDAMGGSGRLPPPVRALFSNPPGRATVLPIDNNQGWFVVTTGRIVPGNPAQAKAFAPAIAQQMLPALADEYAQQFLAAVRAEVGVTRDAAALAALKKALPGGGGVAR